VSNQEKLLTISIDTECDHRPDWSRSAPLSFRNIVSGIPDKLQPVFRAAGAIPTYLLTVEVLEDEECVSALKAVSSDPCEFGTHLHAAFIEPEKKYYDYSGVDSPDFQCSYAADIEFQKLANLTDLFAERFAYAPRSFRAGRYGAGPNTLISLEKLNYEVDTSVTPSMQWSDPKQSVDFRKAPLQPYTPHIDDIAHKADVGSREILEVPITMRPRFGRSPQWLRPWFSDFETMKRVVQLHLRRYADEPLLVLNMMFHSMEVIPEASPYPQSDSDVRKFLSQLSQILDWCAELGFENSRLCDVRERYLAAAHHVR